MEKRKNGNSGRGMPEPPRHPRQYGGMDNETRLILNLRDLGHVVRFLYEGRGSQKQILITLCERGGMTQRELTERLRIQSGSASEVLGKLESAGLIRRTPSASDRRTADISLTPEGSARAQEIIRQRQSRHEEMFSVLSEEEKMTLLQLAEKLNADWAKRYCGGGAHRRG